MKTLKKITAVMMALLMLLATFSIAFTSSAASKKRVTKVSLDKTSITLYTTQTATLKATVSPSNATNKKVKWKSSNTSVATVSSSGKITAKKAGTATITCTSEDNTNRRATCKVTVKTKVNVSSVKLDKTSITLYTTQTATLKATVSPSNATNKKVKWRSSNTSVATVSSSGKITAKKAGTATITCTSEDNTNRRATCKVTVKTKVNVSSVKLNKTSLKMYTTQTTTLKATVSPSNASVKDVKWKSSNTSVATVSSSGKITAKKAGKVTITCTSKDNSKKKATCTVTVTKKVNVSSVKLSASAMTITNGNSKRLTATVSPSNASVSTVKWKSSNSKVATVTSAGKVTAVGVGTATITCTSTDNANKKATCKVTVTPIKVSGLKLNKTSATIYPKKTVTLKATVSPSNADNKAVSWKSSSTSIATVSSSGVVTGVKAGTATITCTAKDGSGKKATCKITVGVPVKSVKITSTEVSKNAWYVGKTGELSVTVSPSNATNKGVTWTSSKPECVSVDSNGNVKVIKQNTYKIFGIERVDDDQNVTITATSKYDSSIKATYNLTIIKDKVAVESVSIDTTNTSGLWIVGREYDVSAATDPAEASNPKIKYTSSDKSVATVSSTGKVKILKAGKATITATSVDDSQKSNKLDIEAIAPTLSITYAAPQNGYFVVGESPLFSFESNLSTSVIKSKLGGLKYEVNDPDMALVTQEDGTLYSTVKFLKAGTLKIRVRTVNEGIVSNWVTVKVRDLMIENDFFENVKPGDKINIGACIYDGKNRIVDDKIDVLYISLYPEISVSDDGSYVKINKELSSEGAYIEVATSDGRLRRNIYFIPGNYTIPTSKSSRLALMKKFSNEMYTDSFLANYSKRINFENLVSDKKNSSTEILFDWGIFKNLDLSGLLKAMGGSGDTGDVDDDLSDLDFVETLFGENIVENSNTVQKSSCPKPITVSADAVNKISVDDKGSTYTIKMTLKDQEEMLPDAVTASEYAKTMPVIDKAYLDNYIKSFNQIDGLTDGDESIKISDVSYGTVNQTYTDGYVEYTVDKFTNKVTKSVYHYNSKLDAKNAKLNLEATVDGVDDIVMKINIKAAFSMNVDNTLVLGDIIY